MKRVKIALELTEGQLMYIDFLANRGVIGSTRAEVIFYMIGSKIMDMTTDRVVPSTIDTFDLIRSRDSK